MNLVIFYIHYVHSYGLPNATPFDVRIILLAQLEKLKNGEKAAVISEMKIPKKSKEVKAKKSTENQRKETPMQSKDNQRKPKKS